jgi:hypothetical protein
MRPALGQLPPTLGQPVRRWRVRLTGAPTLGQIRQHLDGRQSGPLLRNGCPVSPRLPGGPGLTRRAGLGGAGGFSSATPPGAMGNHARPGRWTWTRYANTWAYLCGQDGLTGPSFEHRRQSMGGMLGKTPWPAPPSSAAGQRHRPAPEALPGATRILRLATGQRQFDTRPQDASSRAVVRSFATGRSTATATGAPGDIVTRTVESWRAARRPRQSCTH